MWLTAHSSHSLYDNIDCLCFSIFDTDEKSQNPGNQYPIYVCNARYDVVC